MNTAKLLCDAIIDVCVTLDQKMHLHESRELFESVLVDINLMHSSDIRFRAAEGHRHPRDPWQTIKLLDYSTTENGTESKILCGVLDELSSRGLILLSAESAWQRKENPAPTDTVEAKRRPICFFGSNGEVMQPQLLLTKNDVCYISRKITEDRYRTGLYPEQAIFEAMKISKSQSQQRVSLMEAIRKQN